jgi:hypothetical protein
MQCETGKQILSHRRAVEMRKRVGQDRRKDMSIYLCELCHNYHLTKRHGKY